MPRPTSPLRAAAGLLASIALVACSTAPTASPAPPTATAGLSPSPTTTAPPASPAGSADADAIYATIRQQVVVIRGLQPTKDVAPVLIGEAQLRTNLEKEFDAENTADALRITEDVWVAMGLVPAGSSLRQMSLDLLSGQVIGYYAPDKDELFVVSRSGGPGPVERVTYAHEFTHQLQDQNFAIDKLASGEQDQTDRSLAWLALLEGDASYVQTVWTGENLNSQELGELLQASLDPKAIEALRSAPAILRDTALFPYQYGAILVQRLTVDGGYDAVNAAFAAPPDSTEQVIHPDKYTAREAPIRVAIPRDVATKAGSGWTADGEDTLGEFVLQVWLEEHGVDRGSAQDAAAGWGGDRLVLLHGPKGAVGVGIVTEWDTAADATEFARAVTTALSSPLLAGRIAHAAGTKKVVIALGDRSAEVLAALGG